MAGNFAGCRSEGLTSLVAALKGKAFRDVNQELRHYAQRIADEAAPHIQLAVAMSPAPQAQAMSKTVRTKRDRVPVIVIGKTNPKFRSGPFTRKGSDSARRRGSIAHGIIYGPKGGHRRPPSGQNFYNIGRDESGGRLGRTLKNGPAVRAAETAYLRAYVAILNAYGFNAET